MISLKDSNLLLRLREIGLGISSFYNIKDLYKLKPYSKDINEINNNPTGHYFCASLYILQCMFEKP